MKYPALIRATKLSTLIPALLLAACSASVEGGSPTLPNIPNHPSGDGDFAHKVSGPSIEGRWLSSCVRDKWSSSNGYITFDVTYRGQAITKIEKEFSDSQCSNKKKETTNQGEWRYFASHGADVYELEYWMAFGNGGKFKSGDNTKLSGNSLWISNRYLGEMVKPDIELFRDGPAQKPTPAPQPTPNPSPLPTSEFGPLKGQVIVYEGSYLGSKQVETYENQGYDATYKEWTVSYKIDGRYPDSGTDYWTEMWSSADTKTKLASCVANGGKLETITVKAGTFETCKVQESSRLVWYGNVPFMGKVKIQNLDGRFVTEVARYTL